MGERPGAGHCPPTVGGTTFSWGATCPPVPTPGQQKALGPCQPPGVLHVTSQPLLWLRQTRLQAKCRPSERAGGPTNATCRPCLPAYDTRATTGVIWWAAVTPDDPARAEPARWDGWPDLHPYHHHNPPPPPSTTPQDYEVLQEGWVEECCDLI
ncbi:hypothetical protein GWK47_015314 [Chionoecetes opilio]|uniref:Uncharacterized protein n=1 Tax=Chionoecetes opilio TaxID=41210 RepID=A0A8J5CKN1_CHIOP|nr:hypothetical protein GWK47_015314 [Chionoecetes opilio]